jgi:orotate phosphoribosyltransferase
MIAKEIANILLKIKAVFLRPNEPFTWASGIKSPIYCDNRLIISFPEERKKIENSLADLISRNFPDCEVIAGTGTAGIPHAAYVSWIMNLPMIYVRGSEKDHGRKNLMEGNIEPNQKTVVIEDLISTGGSVISAVRALRNFGANVLGTVSIFTYNMESGMRNLKSNNIKNISLVTFDELLETALENKFITEEDFQKLLIFRKNPKFQ